MYRHFCAVWIVADEKRKETTYYGAKTQPTIGEKIALFHRTKFETIFLHVHITVIVSTKNIRSFGVRLPSMNWNMG